jgi:two-component system phosphate regulon sensor histidine kinase PhoR
VAKERRLIWRLFPSYLLITVISVVVITWYASHSLRRFFLQETIRDLQSRAQLIEERILKGLDPLDEEWVDGLCKRVGEASSTRITVILPSGRVVGDSEEDPGKMDNHRDRPEIIQALRGSLGVSKRFSRTLEKNMMYVGLPLRKESELVAVVRTSLPLTGIEETIADVQIKIALVGLLIAAVAAFVSLWVSRRISHPIEEIRMGAERFARGDLDSRLPVTHSEEIGSLSVALNQMAADLQDRINAMMRQQSEMEGVLASMVEGVIAVDAEERVISMNRAAARMFVCNNENAKGRSIQEVVRNTVLQQFVKDALSSREPIEKDIILYSDGEKYLNAHGSLLRDAHGRQMGALIVLNDITRLRRLENIRRDFVANVSHEIKTPITAIKAGVETLREGAIKSKNDSRRFLEIVEKHAERLEAIIEDLLSLSRIEQESERNGIEQRDNPVHEVFQSAAQVCKVKADSRKVEIRISCDEEIRVRMNSAMMEQAIVNLLDNAIKFSEEGGVVHLEATPTDHEVLLNVRDHGRGVAKEHHPRLFERFYRVDNGRSRDSGGTGLGLAIVKHITQAHGGRVTVKSEPGQGSTFSIHIPKS